MKLLTDRQKSKRRVGHTNLLGGGNCANVEQIVLNWKLQYSFARTVM